MPQIITLDLQKSFDEFIDENLGDLPAHVLTVLRMAFMSGFSLGLSAYSDGQEKLHAELFAFYEKSKAIAQGDFEALSTSPSTEPKGPSDVHRSL